MAPNNGKDFTNSNNYLDDIGIRHNLIVRDYYSIGMIYSDESYLEFIEKNKSKYNIEENKYIDVKLLTNQRILINKLVSDEDFINFVLSKLPKSIDKTKFADFLNTVGEQETIDNAMKIIINFENEIVANREIDEVSKNNTLLFLSTFRHSTSLWFK